MEITSIDLYPTRSSDRVLTYASIVFDDEFVVHNIRLIQTEEKLIVAMPNEEYDGGFRDIAHPITQECREKIRGSLLETYKEEIGPIEEDPDSPEETESSDERSREAVRESDSDSET